MRRAGHALVLMLVLALPSTAAPTVKGADLELLDAVRRIAGKIETLRGQSFSRPPVAVRAPDEIRRVAAEIRGYSRLGPARLAARGRAWADVGLGNASSPATLQEWLAADLAGVAVEVEQRRLLVAPDRLTGDDFVEGDALFERYGIRPDEPVIAHALVHLLQLEQRGDDFDSQTTDRLLARRAWGEGEANLLAVRYVFGTMGLADDVTEVGVDPAEFLEGKLVPETLGTETTGTAAVLARFVYTEGYARAAALFRSGGWSALEAKARGPATTRDLLHPEAATRPAVVLAAPEPPREGLSLVDEDSLGEQGIIVLVSRMTGKDNLALQAGEGWIEDRLRRWEFPAGDPATGISEWLTAWATDADVEDFEYAMRRGAGFRFPGVEPVAPRPGRLDIYGERRWLRMEREGRVVRVLVGAPDSWPRQEPSTGTPAR